LLIVHPANLPGRNLLLFVNISFRVFEVSPEAKKGPPSVLDTASGEEKSSDGEGEPGEDHSGLALA
jgi:hypothetical protein